MDPIRKLVSERLRAQAPLPHPEADLLAAFAENSLPRAERDQVVAHLSDCQACREVLYLSLPEADKAQTILTFKGNRARLARLRWASLVGVVAIVTALVSIRFEFLTTRNHPPTTATLEQPVSTSAQVVEEKAPAENHPASPRVESKQLRTAQQDKQRPEFKAMHAKPTAALDFDRSGEVHLRARPPQSADSSNGALSYNFVAALAENEKKAKLEKGPAQMAKVDALEASQTAAPMGSPMAAPMKLETDSAMTGARREEAKSVILKDGSVSTSIRRTPVIFQGVASIFDWTLSPQGAVLRSSDQGKTWQELGSSPPGPFSALSSVGTHVWVGGKNGSLYHSADSGQSWRQVTPAMGSHRLTADVTHVEFTDPMNGVASTTDGESWTTVDGGLTWHN